MNTINKILVIVVVIIAINYFSNGNLMIILKRYYDILFKHTENFIGLTYKNIKNVYSNIPNIPYERQLDFPYHNKSNLDELEEDSYYLYNFINSLITPNVNNNELTKSNSKRQIANDKLIKEILNNIDKLFNHRGYKFENIKLLEKIYYYENPRGKEIEPFTFSARVSYLNKYIGDVKINIESFLREDKFYYRQGDTGFLTINNIHLLDRTYPDELSRHKNRPSAYRLSNKKSYKKAIDENNKLVEKMTNSFNNHFVNRENYDDLFIKPTEQFTTEGFTNDTENSLIPSVVNITCTDESTE
jgi:hypothetical protein